MCQELSHYENLCHCPFTTPFITTRCVRERGSLVYKYQCCLCVQDATIRVTANLQRKEACRHPPKTTPGWKDTHYRPSTDPTESEYPLPTDPHLENRLFNLDGRRTLPISPLKDLNGTAHTAGGPIMTIRSTSTGARFAPYV